MAERAAWDFTKELPEGEKFDLVVINPVFIVGPSICGPGFASQKVIEKIVTGQYPGMPKTKTAVVDVRDCAAAHLKAIEVEAAANNRFITSSRGIWMTDLAQELHEEFNP